MGPLGLKEMEQKNEGQRRRKNTEVEEGWECLENIRDDVIWSGHVVFQHPLPHGSVPWSLTNICMFFITGPEKLNSVCIYLDSSMQSWGWIQALEEENCLSRSQREKAALSIRCIWMRLRRWQDLGGIVEEVPTEATQTGKYTLSRAWASDQGQGWSRGESIGCFMRWGIFLKSIYYNWK